MHFKYKIDPYNTSNLRSIIVCGQNEGNIDLIDMENLENLMKLKQKKISHIYQLIQTSRLNEIAIAAYNGIHFLTIQSTNYD